MNTNCCGLTYELMQRMVIPVRREQRITWVEGLTHANEIKEFDIRGIIFPLTGKELLLVPEGDRFRQNVWLYTQEDVRDNDVVVYGEMPFEVQTVQNWGSFKQARAMRLDVGPDGDQ